ncbi:MAG TPA: hypothetical protein VL087_10110 [Nitrospirota bacterium]|nr:hypothetical protein [Nitrospirota bacterium]
MKTEPLSGRLSGDGYLALVQGIDKLLEHGCMVIDGIIGPRYV